jgi:hypothetical protein
MADSSGDLDIDRVLREWAFLPGRPLVRRVRGSDGRDLVQMRVDMGLLQLEVSGRPDGERPQGFPTYYDFLVAAAFDEGGLLLTLTFERAIDISGIDPAALIVDDGDVGFRYEGVGPASLDGPATVTVGMTGTIEVTEPGVTLDATAASGIVAVDDGGTWAGATDLSLPFP